VNLWLANQDAAKVQCDGHVSDWDTSSVVYSMSRLFKNAIDFNDDISSWDIS
jgi:hypothetical protein